MIYIISLVDKLFENKTFEIRCKIKNEIINTLLVIHKGQCMDIYWGDFALCPTIEEYFQMIKYKTAELFTCIVKISNCISNTEGLILIYQQIGIFYQIRDDFCNIVDPEYWKKKGFYEDSDEGKYSYPVINFLSNESNNIENKEWLKKTLLKKKLNLDSKLTIYQLLVPTLKNCRIKLINFKNEISNNINENCLFSILDDLYIPDVIENIDEIKSIILFK